MELGRWKDGIRARFVAREFKGDEMVYNVFALISTPSAGRIIDYLSLKKLHHTFTVVVTNASFQVDENEECSVDPVGAEGHTGEFELRASAAAANTKRLQEHRCDAAPQFFANYKLDVVIEVDTHDHHGTRPTQAVDQIQANLFQKICFIIRTVNEVGTTCEHLKCERMLYNDWKEIVPGAKILESRVAQHATDEL